jgi:hypothetical protein
VLLIDYPTSFLEALLLKLDHIESSSEHNVLVVHVTGVKHHPQFYVLDVFVEGLYSIGIEVLGDGLFHAVITGLVTDSVLKFHGIRKDDSAEVADIHPLTGTELVTLVPVIVLKNLVHGALTSLHLDLLPGLR